MRITVGAENLTNFNLNKPLMNLPDWNKELILDRSRWIHDCALELVGKGWLATGKSEIPKWKPASS